MELEFVGHLLDILTVGGTGVVSMPDDIFYPSGTNVCVMAWEAHMPHDITRETFFGYGKDDGFVKRKKLGRIDAD